MGQISDEPDRYQPKLLVLLCAHYGRPRPMPRFSKADAMPGEALSATMGGKRTFTGAV
jgi:hypothetical protein